METNSSLELSLGVTWKFNIDGGNQGSPAFSFLNSLWHLHVYPPLSCTSTAICLRNKDPGKIFQPFPVTTYIKSSNHIGLAFSHIRRFSTNTHVIWMSDPDWSASGDVTVICLLGDGSTSIQCTEKDTGCKRKYVSLDASSPSHSTYSANDVSHPSQSPFSSSECPLINLESLSQDYSNLLEENLMPDVQLRSGDCTLTAHKFVLSVRSEVFRAMFEHKMAETNSGVVDIKDIEPSVLSVFLKYLYSGKITEKLSDDTICKLYTASDKYSVSSLSKLCSDFMAKCLREDNYLQILVLADAHSDEKLKKAVADFVLKNKVLLKSENWITFSTRHPILANEIYRAYFTTSV